LWYGCEQEYLLGVSVMEKLAAVNVMNWTGRIIDVRGYDEFAAERLAKAECVPLDRILSAASQWDPSERLLLMCKSGMRSGKAAEQLAQVGFKNLLTLEGGIEACEAAGIEIVRSRQPIPIFRQVMVAAGAILLIGLALAHFSPWFLLIDAFVAVGLVVAGLTGFCPMAKLLAVMPWNAPSSCTSKSCC